MHKYLAIVFCLFLAACVATPESQKNRHYSRRTNPGPNLDRNYEVGSKPPATMVDAPHMRD
jgi:starvation-inducible outer membrane lipoprotein